MTYSEQPKSGCEISSSVNQIFNNIICLKENDVQHISSTSRTGRKKETICKTTDSEENRLTTLCSNCCNPHKFRNSLHNEINILECRSVLKKIMSAQLKLHPLFSSISVVEKSNSIEKLKRELILNLIEEELSLHRESLSSCGAEMQKNYFNQGDRIFQSHSHCSLDEILETSICPWENGCLESLQMEEQITELCSTGNFRKCSNQIDTLINANKDCTSKKEEINELDEKLIFQDLNDERGVDDSKLQGVDDINKFGYKRKMSHRECKKNLVSKNLFIASYSKIETTNFPQQDKPKELKYNTVESLDKVHASLKKITNNSQCKPNTKEHMLDLKSKSTNLTTIKIKSSISSIQEIRTECGCSLTSSMFKSFLNISIPPESICASKITLHSTSMYNHTEKQLLGNAPHDLNTSENSFQIGIKKSNVIFKIMSFVSYRPGNVSNIQNLSLEMSEIVQNRECNHTETTKCNQHIQSFVKQDTNSYIHCNSTLYCTHLKPSNSKQKCELQACEKHMFSDTQIFKSNSAYIHTGKFETARKHNAAAASSFNFKPVYTIRKYEKTSHILNTQKIFCQSSRESEKSTDYKPGKYYNEVNLMAFTLSPTTNEDYLHSKYICIYKSQIPFSEQIFVQSYLKNIGFVKNLITRPKTSCVNNLVINSHGKIYGSENTYSKLYALDSSFFELGSQSNLKNCEAIHSTYVVNYNNNFTGLLYELNLRNENAKNIIIKSSSNDYIESCNQRMGAASVSTLTEVINFCDKYCNACRYFFLHANSSTALEKNQSNMEMKCITSSYTCYTRNEPNESKIKSINLWEYFSKNLYDSSLMVKQKEPIRVGDTWYTIDLSSNQLMSNLHGEAEISFTSAITETAKFSPEKGRNYYFRDKCYNHGSDLILYGRIDHTLNINSNRFLYSVNVSSASANNIFQKYPYELRSLEKYDISTNICKHNIEHEASDVNNSGKILPTKCQKYYFGTKYYRCWADLILCGMDSHESRVSANVGPCLKTASNCSLLSNLFPLYFKTNEHTKSKQRFRNALLASLGSIVYKSASVQCSAENFEDNINEKERCIKHYIEYTVGSKCNQKENVLNETNIFSKNEIIKKSSLMFKGGITSVYGTSENLSNGRYETYYFGKKHKRCSLEIDSVENYEADVYGSTSHLQDNTKYIVVKKTDSIFNDRSEGDWVPIPGETKEENWSKRKNVKSNYSLVYCSTTVTLADAEYIRSIAVMLNPMNKLSDETEAMSYQR